MTSTAILIPARLNSKRLPEKPLIDLGRGKTLIETVYEKCAATGYPTFVLTDSDRIVSLFGREICWKDDSSLITNGTMRCSYAMGWDRLDSFTHFVNVQGDMPDITPQMIDAALKGLRRRQEVSTIYTKMPDEKLADPSTVKLIRGTPSIAAWFGRGFTYGDWHLGVYGYTRSAISYYRDLNIHYEELVENLEQLRWIQNGISISTKPVDFDGVEINTYEDVNEWKMKNLSPT